MAAAITVLVLGLLFLVIGESRKREIGVAWAVVLSIFATPIIALICVVISPRIDKPSRFFPINYKPHLKEEFEELLDYYKKEEIAIEKVVPEIEYYQKLLKLDPSKLFRYFEFYNIKAKEKEIVPFYKGEKISKFLKSADYIITGFYL